MESPDRDLRRTQAADRWRVIKGLLDAWEDIEPPQRETWLAEQCAGDDSLLEEVRSYLSYEDQLTDLEAPVDSAVDVLEELDAREAGRRIGPYRLDGLLARGGMGAVYRAHREEEFEQSVALKLVRSGFETPATLQRFHKERQILARLEHPHIARLLDGGTTEDGSPYFVMELIEGQRLDHYCDAHQLPIRRRLELVLQVCEALRFAHANLILHLDLKPGNILVTDDGQAKLLDFGIGKLLGANREPNAGDATVGPRPFTLSYASPEQLLSESVSTASDIYSLGVVLYELLTGHLPSEDRTSQEAKIQWLAGHDTPPAPSAMVTRRGESSSGPAVEGSTPETMARAREHSLVSLRRRLRGDLDAITLRALEKEPTARYASVEQLAADLRRHLDGLPVEARQGNLAYRVGKYVRRNRLRLSAAAVILALSLTFTAVLARQLTRIEAQRQRAEGLSQFTVDLLRAAEPDGAGEQLSVHDLVDLVRKQLEMGLEDQPEARSRLLLTLGQVYHRLGDFSAARSAQEEAIDILRREVDPNHPDIAVVSNDLAVVAYSRGEYERAETHFRQAIDLRERLGTDEDLHKPRNNLAAILVLRGQLDEAEEIYRQTLAQRWDTLGPRHANIAVSLQHLATVHYLRGELDAAERLLGQSLEIRIENHGRQSASAATALAGLGRVAHARGDLDTAEAFYLEALRHRLERLAPDHLSVALLEVDLARLFLERDAVESAGVLLGRAHGPIHRHKPAGDPARARFDSVYGSYLAARGHRDAAQVCLEDSLRTLERVQGRDLLPVHDARQRLARLNHP